MLRIRTTNNRWCIKPIHLTLAGMSAIALFATPSAFAQTAQKLAALPVEVPSVTQRSILQGHVDPTQVVSFAISMPVPNPAAFEAFAESVSDPKSPNYLKFITPKEVGAKFGQPSAKVQAVADYLKKYGIKVTLVADNGLSILAQGTMAQAEKAFNTTINNYTTLSKDEPGNNNYFSYAKPLQVPTTISKTVLTVTGLENFTKPKAKMALDPTQTRAIYNSAPIYASGFKGQGRTIAVSNFDGFRLSNVPLFYTQFGLPTPAGGLGSNVRVVVCGTGSGSGTPDGEGDLDIQMVLSTAPLCDLIVYDGQDLISVLTQEANDNRADIITESYGWNIPPSVATSAHNLHLAMTSQGITYMAATGDNGTSLEPFSYPNYEPEVLEVGGTVASVDGSGNRTSEIGWSGSGSGWSTNSATFNKLPSWQKDSGVPSNINFRLNPDLSLHASGANPGGAAYPFFQNGSLNIGPWGTSFASPVLAGLLGTAEQKLISLGRISANGAGKLRLGRIQNLIYSQKMRSDVWFDVISGPSSGTLPNGQSSVVKSGWDFVTGLGVMNINGFVNSFIPETPPAIYAPATVSIYNSLGTAPSGGVAQMANADNSFYTLNSVKSSAGSIAAPLVTFQLTGTTSTITSFNLEFVGMAATAVTSFVYALNVNTGNYDLISANPMPGSSTTLSLLISNPQDYINGTTKKVTVLIRDVFPQRLNSLPFKLKIDKLNLVANF